MMCSGKFTWSFFPPHIAVIVLLGPVGTFGQNTAGAGVIASIKRRIAPGLIV